MTGSSLILNPRAQSYLTTSQKKKFNLLSWQKNRSLRDKKKSSLAGLSILNPRIFILKTARIFLTLVLVDLTEIVACSLERTFLLRLGIKLGVLNLILDLSNILHQKSIKPAQIFLCSGVLRGASQAPVKSMGITIVVWLRPFQSKNRAPRFYILETQGRDQRSH